MTNLLHDDSVFGAAWVEDPICEQLQDRTRFGIPGDSPGNEASRVVYPLGQKEISPWFTLETYNLRKHQTPIVRA